MINGREDWAGQGPSTFYTGKMMDPLGSPSAVKFIQNVIGVEWLEWLGGR
jgi:hypothetical protein